MSESDAIDIDDSEPAEAEFDGATPAPLPELIAELLVEADLRITDYLKEHDGEAEGFVASDFVAVYRALTELVASGAPPGGNFCEWGSGFGVIAMIASHVGFEAHGIELIPELAEAANELASDYDFDAEFVAGTFVPPDAEAREQSDRFLWDDGDADDGHEALGVDIAEWDVVFAYPWPGEAWLVESVFAEGAAPGALLVTFEDGSGVRVREKLETGELKEIEVSSEE